MISFISSFLLKRYQFLAFRPTVSVILKFLNLSCSTGCHNTPKYSGNNRPCVHCKQFYCHFKYDVNVSKSEGPDPCETFDHAKIEEFKFSLLTVNKLGLPQLSARPFISWVLMIVFPVKKNS